MYGPSQWHQGLQTLQGHHQETPQRGPGSPQKGQQGTQDFKTYDWSKPYYNKLLPTGKSFPAPRFYGLPKIHKANCPMCPIFSAYGTTTYQLAKFLTKILQRYRGITPSFVKDSKSFSEHLRFCPHQGGWRTSLLWHFSHLHQYSGPHSLRCNQSVVLWTYWGSWSQTQIWLFI